MHRHVVINIAGEVATGKTTVADLLEKHLIGIGAQVQVRDEPGRKANSFDVTGPDNMPGTSWGDACLNALKGRVEIEVATAGVLYGPKPERPQHYSKKLSIQVDGAQILTHHVWDVLHNAGFIAYMPEGVLKPSDRESIEAIVREGLEVLITTTQFRASSR